MYRKKMFILMGLVMALAVLAWGAAPSWALAPVTAPSTTPDYFQTPNYANSPPLTKFVDSLAPLCTYPTTSLNTNNLGQCIPLATPNLSTTTYAGSDYYEIALVEYREQMHSDLLPVVGDKTSPTATGGTKLRGYVQEVNGVAVGEPHYLGPVIIAQKDKPVRIKFTNRIDPTSSLFVPVDKTIMGSGEYEINYDPVTKQPITQRSGMFSENRATLHLHGGRSPWISDGTPHQWTAPAGDTSNYSKGVSVQYVPDMWYTSGGAEIPTCAGLTTCGEPGATNNPGDGKLTFYYTNQQSARLMFYHDHAWGLTRLNVYVGEAAGYIIQDAAEAALVAAGTIPPMADTIPLIIQDKTFVDPARITTTDPTWAWGSVAPSGHATPPTISGEGMNPVLGDLWWPHVYMPAQNPFASNFSGINDFGRWHYGPWFNPPTLLCGSGPDIVVPWCVTHAAIANPYYNEACDPATAGFCQPPLIPGTPDVSWGAEAFLDTMMVNGTVYPTVTVEPQKYRFRILNASHDRFLNLQLYRAVSKLGGSAWNDPAARIFDDANKANLTEVSMVTAASNSTYPPDWPTDDREGGVPDPATSGPAFIQIGTEGGFLPGPVVLPNQPVKWNQDPAMFNVGNVLQQNEGGGTLFLGPAERADVIVDFTNFAGHTLILYNDAPTAFPALVPQYDYFTGAPDRSDSGGYTEVLAGFGPNIRTVMQIVVNGSGGTAPVNDYNTGTFSALQTAFTTSAGGPGVFAASQDPIVVGQTAYNAAYGVGFPYTYPNWGISNIFSTTLSFLKTDGTTTVSNYPMLPKAIHDEMGGTFDDYGRMSAKLGLEVKNSNAALSTFSMQMYVDPATEFVNSDKVQIWKVTHNGVDAHPIHFHLFDVQVINRVGWDGFIRLPDANELGWKDTVRMHPLEDTIVAFRPIIPQVPFVLPESVRPLNPAIPLGSTMGFGQLDPATGAALEPLQANVMANFGFEYVWHCHILSHEENDMMRSIQFRVKDHIGVFRGNGEWYTDASGNGAWDANIDKSFLFGTTGDTPVSGDWNGEAIVKPGVFNNGLWSLDVNGDGTATAFTFGAPGDIPITGDWNGAGKTKIGVVRGNTWFLDMNGNGTWDGGDVAYSFGVPSDIWITGDWNGDGRTKIGAVRGNTWFLDMNGNGAWDDGIDVAYSFGVPGDTWITGDWSGDGKTKIGVFRGNAWFLDMNGNGTWDAADATYNFGVPGDKPVIGKW